MKIIYLLLAVLISGCAFNQSIALVSDGDIINNRNIHITDARLEKSKKTRFNADDEKCSRWYGDDFILPNKISYLAHSLSSIQSNSNINVVIYKYETIEYCMDTTNRVKAIATAAALAAVVGGVHYYKIPGPVGGDFFRLHISGLANNKPFNFSGDFVYSDISFTNFPSESQEYRERVKKLFTEATKYIRDVSN